MLQCSINRAQGLRPTGRACLGPSESATEADENRVAPQANARRTRGELDIRARIRHDSRDAALRDAAPRGAGLTRTHVVRS
jgi:hypothetical protein